MVEGLLTGLGGLQDGGRTLHPLISWLGALRELLFAEKGLKLLGGMGYLEQVEGVELQSGDFTGDFRRRGTLLVGPGAGEEFFNAHVELLSVAPDLGTRSGADVAFD
jgi:hypothetical protein